MCITYTHIYHPIPVPAVTLRPEGSLSAHTHVIFYSAVTYRLLVKHG